MKQWPTLKIMKSLFSPKAVNTDDSVFYNAGRIFANDGNIKYEGCVHEYPVVTDKSLTLVSLKLPRVIVRHDGYEKEVRADKNKTVRNITLIKKSFRKNLTTLSIIIITTEIQNP